MFDSILVPLDGSLLSECVLPHVIAIGQAVNAKITLLHVLDKNQDDASPQLFDLLNVSSQKMGVAWVTPKTRRDSVQRAR